MENSIQNKSSDTEIKIYSAIQNKSSDTEIKIYSDFYADPNYVLVGYKGKQVEAPGVFFIPYKKPNIFVRLFGKIRGFFIKSKAVPLSKDSNGWTLYSSNEGM
jgi:hypothetical protein